FLKLKMIRQRVQEIYRHHPALCFVGIYAGGIYLCWHFLNKIQYEWLFVTAFVFLLSFILTYFFVKKLFIPAMLGFIILLGMINIYQSMACFKPDDLVVTGTKNVQSFTGWIAETHFRKDGNHQYVLKLISVKRDSMIQPASGKLLLKQRRLHGRLKYGDILTVFGKPEQPPLPANPGEFNYRRYLQLNGIFFQYYLSKEQDYRILKANKGSAWQRYIIQPLKNNIIRILDDNVPPPAVDVLKALILGERQDVDRPILENFQRTGVIHVLAISGLHVGFILLIFMTVFSLLNFSYRMRIIFSLIFLFIFVALVDFKAPVVRASLMAGLYFSAKLFERRTNALNILGLAGLIILAVDPRQLFQAGFQFSFAAVGGILYGYPKLTAGLPKPSRFRWAPVFNKSIGRPFIVSLAAVLATSPLTLWYYGSLQLGALLVNILIIPSIGLLVISAFVLLAAGAFGLGLSPGLGMLQHSLFTGISETVDFFASLPFVQIELPHPPPAAVAVLSLAVFMFFRLNRFRRFVSPSLLVLIVLLFIWTPEKSDANLRITFTNVGQGDGAVIRFPN
ncbi:MAG: ComEC/Rec2 family competence protein, partial [Calditrichaceae bacterium]